MKIRSNNSLVGSDHFPPFNVRFVRDGEVCAALAKRHALRRRYFRVNSILINKLPHPFWTQQLIYHRCVHTVFTSDAHSRRALTPDLISPIPGPAARSRGRRREKFLRECDKTQSVRLAASASNVTNGMIYHMEISQIESSVMLSTVAARAAPARKKEPSCVGKASPRTFARARAQTNMPSYLWAIKVNRRRNEMHYVQFRFNFVRNKEPFTMQWETNGRWWNGSPVVRHVDT